MAGDDHDFRAVREGNFLDARQRLQAIHAGEPDVEQDHVVGAAGQLFQALLSALDGGAGVALVLEHAA